MLIALTGCANAGRGERGAASSIDVKVTLTDPMALQFDVTNKTGRLVHILQRSDNRRLTKHPMEQPGNAFQFADGVALSTWNADGGDIVLRHRDDFAWEHSQEELLPDVETQWVAIRPHSTTRFVISLKHFYVSRINGRFFRLEDARGLDWAVLMKYSRYLSVALPYVVQGDPHIESVRLQLKLDSSNLPSVVRPRGERSVIN